MANSGDEVIEGVCRATTTEKNVWCEQTMSGVCWCAGVAADGDRLRALLSAHQQQQQQQCQIRVFSVYSVCVYSVSARSSV